MNKERQRGKVEREKEGKRLKESKWIIQAENEKENKKKRNKVTSITRKNVIHGKRKREGK